MRKFYLSIVVICVSTFVFGQGNVIFPLSVGNYWEVVDSSFQDTTVYVDTLRLEVTGDTIINYQGNNYDVYFLQWEDSETKWLVRNQNDGFWAYGYYSTNDTLIDPELVSKYPVSVGDSWQSNWAAMGDTALVECVAIDTIVATPAGSFSCVAYRVSELSKNKKGPRGVLRNILKFRKNHSKIINHNETDQTNVLYSHLSPNIGYVQQINQENSVVVNKTTLLSYNVVTSIEITNYPIINYLLHQNYPNPFNPSTTISFSIPKNSKVELSVYNITGQKIKTLVNENLPPGYHKVVWNGKDKSEKQVSSGIYFYKIKTENFSDIKKSILLK